MPAPKGFLQTWVDPDIYRRALRRMVKSGFQKDWGRNKVVNQILNDYASESLVGHFPFLDSRHKSMMALLGLHHQMTNEDLMIKLIEDAYKEVSQSEEFRKRLNQSSLSPAKTDSYLPPDEELKREGRGGSGK